MGGHDFQTYRAGTSMRDAYREACDDARYEEGHDGYNGTISTTSGVMQAAGTQAPMTRNGAQLFVGTVPSQSLEKWGSAHAIPVADDARFTFTPAKKFTLELPASEPVLDWQGKPRTGMARQTNVYDLQEAAVAEAFKRFGNAVHTVETTPEIKTKVVSVATPGPSMLKYEILGSWGPTKKLHDTKAQAVAAVKALLSNPNGSNGATMSVRAVKYWPEADTTNAVTLHVETVSAKVTVEVTVAKAKPRATASERPFIDGWLFFGIAAS